MCTGSTCKRLEPVNTMTVAGRSSLLASAEALPLKPLLLYELLLCWELFYNRLQLSWRRELLPCS